MLKNCIGLFCLLLAGSGLASMDRIYMSPMEESRWILTSDTPLRCEIQHRIPRFGTVSFYQESGRGLKLKVETLHPYKKDLKISFRSVTANWKNIHTESEMGALLSNGGHTLVDVANDQARHAYFELQQGYQPSLFFDDVEDALSSVAVIMSTVYFREVEADFGDCRRRLFPYHFDDIKTATVHFDFDEEFPIEHEEDQYLEKILDYLKIDDSVEQLVIAGHADYKGSECYNDSLSARRAWYVYDYLVQSGVEPRRLQVEFFGENKPLKKGRDDLSRALNRRVTVTMVR